MITRDELGWDSVNAAKTNTDMGMVVHYDGFNQRLAHYACLACRQYWLATRNFHVQANGWIDIGYAYGVCPHGEVYEGRGYGRAQAAAKQGRNKLPNGNYRWVNVSFMSGPDEQPTANQLYAFQRLRERLMDEGMQSAVRCHRDFSDTDCPGPILTRLVRSGQIIDGSGVSKVNPKEVWNYEIPVPFGTEENPEWRAKSLLINTNQRLRTVEAKLDMVLAALGMSGEENDGS